jgi:hypothetical protein
LIIIYVSGQKAIPGTRTAGFEKMGNQTSEAPMGNFIETNLRGLLGRQESPWGGQA